jgi:hypothetical protein
MMAAPRVRRGVLIRCPRGRKPQFVIDEAGIEVKCHVCRGEIFRVSWAILEQIRADLAAGREVLARLE